jgi:CRISPR-associated endonuclease Csn1
MTLEVQKREREGRQDDIFHIQQPWPGFRLDVGRAVYGENGSGGVFVSRAERRRARGKAHDATIRQIRLIDGEKVVYERKAIEKLTENDLDQIPIPKPYGNVADPAKLRTEMVEALRAWIAAGKPKGEDKLPRSSKGDIIRKVRVATKDHAAIQMRGGTVDRGDMGRVDVFRKKGRKNGWQFYIVPIYPHQIATMDFPPNRAVVAYKSEDVWPQIDETFEFLWSLNPMSYVVAVKSSGVVVEGYFRGLHRGTGAANISRPNSLGKEATTDGVGLKTLKDFRKFTVDRLGRKFQVSREVRTWHGKACT